MSHTSYRSTEGGQILLNRSICLPAIMTYCCRSNYIMGSGSPLHLAGKHACGNTRTGLMLIKHASMEGLRICDSACRRRHADALEYILFLNLHAHILYKGMHGDTGTYQIAFMLAGKGQLFNQVCSSCSSCQTTVAVGCACAWHLQLLRLMWRL